MSWAYDRGFGEGKGDAVGGRCGWNVWCRPMVGVRRHRRQGGSTRGPVDGRGVEVRYRKSGAERGSEGEGWGMEQVCRGK